MTADSENNTRTFLFSFPTCADNEKFYELEIPLDIPFSACTKEFTQRIISAFNIPVFLEDELHDAINSFVQKETQEFYNKQDDELIEKARSGDIDVEQVVKNWEKLYKDQTLEYADQKGASDEEVFAAAYHRLVHSPALEAILKVESSYARSVQEVIQQRDEDINKLTNNQTSEMEGKMRLLNTFTTESEINELVGKHFEEQSMVIGRWGSQLDALRQAQRAEYRAWLMTILEDHQTNATIRTPRNSPLNQFGSTDNHQNAPTEIASHPERLLEESFTIHLGSQLKQMHNIRIMSADIMKFCKVKQLDNRIMDAPRRLQTALGLYSGDLCGLVVLTDTPPPHYTGLAKQIEKACQQSTEFHFPQMDDQLEKIIEDVKEPVILRNVQRIKNMAESGHQEGSSNRKTKESKYLQTGDIYITKHSNLADVHILFHLIADDSSLRSNDINSRHPAILGLRNILKTACSNDVTTLTLPVLLRHDMSEEMTVAWCAKRAELVLKCVKGFMIEMASWGGSELKNIQFLVPQGISEEVFTTLAAMLPSIFRVSNPLKFKANSQNQ